MKAEKNTPAPIATKAERDRNFSRLAENAVKHQARVKLYGQAVLMFAGFGIFFTSLALTQDPANGDIARDLELLALFGLLVGAFGFACFYNDNKNN